MQLPATGRPSSQIELDDINATPVTANTHSANMAGPFALSTGVWDPSHRFQTSWILPPYVLGAIRLLIVRHQIKHYACMYMYMYTYVYRSAHC